MVFSPLVWCKCGGESGLDRPIQDTMQPEQCQRCFGEADHTGIMSREDLRRYTKKREEQQKEKTIHRLHRLTGFPEDWRAIFF
jgi:hypothetical protein